MIVVNLFAGPGAGKSTTMAGVFSLLKQHGVNVEMAPEFAKELVWEGRSTAIGCQPYIFGKQYFRLHRLAAAQLDCVVTDSPLLLSNVYAAGRMPEEFHWSVNALVNQFCNLDFFIARRKVYDPRGRQQTEVEAQQLDAVIRAQVPTAPLLNGTQESNIDRIVTTVLAKLRKTT
jgi:hypothetical protein